MQFSRSQQVLRCFSITESVKDLNNSFEDKELNKEDFQSQAAKKISNQEVAEKVSDNILKFVISSSYMYSLYNSTFDEKGESVLITFFPNVVEFIEEITEYANSLDDVSSVQWSRFLPEDYENVDDIEYFVVMKINLNIISTISLKTVINKLPAEITKKRDKEEHPLVVPRLHPETNPVPSSKIISIAKKIVELQ